MFNAIRTLSGGHRALLGAFAIPALALSMFATEMSLLDRKKETIFTRLTQPEDEQLKLYTVSHRKVRQSPFLPLPFHGPSVTFLFRNVGRCTSPTARP